jgi:putative hemolysin
LPASPDGRFAAIAGPDKACLAGVTATATAEANMPGMPNPASVFCQEQGGQLEIRTENGGEVGYCRFLDGSECEEWNFFKGDCLPASASVCSFLAGSLEYKLGNGVEAAITAQAPFEDYITGQKETGCRVTVSGTGLDFENIVVLYDAINGMFQEGGWQADFNYSADGPTASLGGYRLEPALCLWEAAWEPSAEANCPQDQPISACQLTPAQTLYTATLNCLQDAAAADDSTADDSTQTHRIQFSPGAISSQVYGKLQANEWDQYVLNAMAGQEMIVRLYDPEVTNAILVIWGDDGTVLISDHAGATDWTGTLPATQDYYIDVKATGQSPVNYTMEVVIPPTTGVSEGPDALEALDELEALVKSKFEEDD